ncbi:MAG: hypothetical protein RL215_345 [Planctomycetota bacterium]
MSFLIASGVPFHGDVIIDRVTGVDGGGETYEQVTFIFDGGFTPDLKRAGFPAESGEAVFGIGQRVGCGIERIRGAEQGSDRREF